MGYPVKIQRVERAGTCSYYINFPVAVAELGGFAAYHNSVYNLRYGLAAEALNVS